MILVFLLFSFRSFAAAENAKALENLLDTRVSFDVMEGDISGVLKALAESFDLNLVVGEGIAGKVSLSLKEVRLEDALDLILETTGYYYQVRDNIIFVQAPEKELVTEIVSLSYVPASEIKGSLEALKSDLGSITTVDAENRIIIKEVPSRIKTILKEIRKLDKAPYQILIEARMIEVEDTDLTAFGIQWNGNLNLAGFSDGKPAISQGRRTTAPGVVTSASGTTTSTTGPSLTNEAVTVESADFKLTLPETSSDLTGGQLVYGFTLHRGQGASIIDALIQTRKAHILASPSIATLDGEEAKIIIGEKFPFRENTLTAVGTTETTKFVDVGTALRVTPKVISEDEIQLQIHPEVSTVTAEIANTGPRIGTREATTKVLVKNGQTIVIAGLIKTDKTVNRQKVPFFGDLPLIGLAFRNKSIDFVTKELAVFITPYLMKPLKGEEGKPVVEPLSPQFFFNRALRLLDETGIESLGMTEGQRYSEAVESFQNIARNFPESDVADDALYQLGMLYYEKIRNPAQAALAWNQLKVGYPDSPYLTLGLSSQINSSRNRAEQEGKKKKKRR